MSVLGFWAAVRRAQQELAKHGDSVWICSIEGAVFGLPGGILSRVNPENAARRLIEGSHRIATAAEIQEYNAEDAERGRTIAATARFFSRVNDGGLKDTWEGK